LRATRNKSVVVGVPVTQILELVLTNMSCVDAVVVGEGEETIVDLVEALTSRGTWTLLTAPRITFKARS